jgi:hypothetical protein
MESGLIGCGMKVEFLVGNENATAEPENFAAGNASRGAFWRSVNGNEIDDIELPVKFSVGESSVNFVDRERRASDSCVGIEDEEV